MFSLFFIFFLKLYICDWNFFESDQVKCIVHEEEPKSFWLPSLQTLTSSLFPATACRRSDFTKLQRLGAVLDEGLFGQEHVVNAIKQTLHQHRSLAPLVFHFTGDNAVGKTWTAQLMARGLFDDPDLAFFQIEGEHFSGPPERREELRDRLAAQVVAHLRACPRALILLDEVSKMAVEVLSVLAPFFEKPRVCVGDRGCVGTREAIFVLTTDFGVEGVTRGKTGAELRQLAEQQVALYWKERPKVADLMQVTLPFHALDSEAAKGVVEREIGEILKGPLARERRLNELCFPVELLDAIVQRYLESETYLDMNARGVKKLTSHYLLPLILDSLDHMEEVPRNSHLIGHISSTSSSLEKLKLTLINSK